MFWNKEQVYPIHLSLDPARELQGNKKNIKLGIHILIGCNCTEAVALSVIQQFN